MTPPVEGRSKGLSGTVTGVAATFTPDQSEVRFYSLLGEPTWSVLANTDLP